MKTYKLLKLAVVFLYLVCVPATLVLAETLKIDYGNPRDIKLIELGSGESANVFVHVASVGEVVEGLRVSLVNLQTRKKLISTADGAGVAKFNEISAGQYIVVLRLPSSMLAKTTVHVGDVTVYLSDY